MRIKATVALVTGESRGIGKVTALAVRASAGCSPSDHPLARQVKVKELYIMDENRPITIRKQEIPFPVF